MDADCGGKDCEGEGFDTKPCSREEELDEMILELEQDKTRLEGDLEDLKAKLNRCQGIRPLQ